MLYGAESWPIDAQVTKLISSFGTIAYRIMTGVQRLDKVCNTKVLATVCRNDLIYTDMIVISGSLDTCFEAHTLHMLEPTRYTSQRTAVQDAVVLEQTETWITSRN